MKSKSNPFRSTAISGSSVVFACFSLLNPSAQATVSTWRGADGVISFDNNTDNAANWVSGVVYPKDFGTVIFDSNTVNGNVSINEFPWFTGGLTLASNLTQNITIGGLTLFTGDADIDMSAAGANLTVNSSLAMYGVAHPSVWIVGAGRTLTFNGGVTDSNNAGLTKSGAGTVVLASAHSGTVGTTINGGTFQIAGAGSLNSGSYAGDISIATGASFLYSSSANQTLSGIISGSGSITMSGSGTLTLTQALNAYPAHLFDGAITVNSGTLNAPDLNWQLNTASSITVNGGTLNTGSRSSEVGNLTLNGGTVTSTGMNPGDAPWGNLLLINNSTVNAGGAAVSTISVQQMNLHGTNGFAVGAGSTLNVTSTIVDYGGAGSLNKTGTGTLTLSGTSTYTGVTTLAGGTLNVASLSDYGVAGSLGNRAAVDDAPGIVGILFQGGTLQYTGSTAQSTNRGIRISTVGGGATIDASGSNPAATLSFTAASSPDFFENGGNRTLTLTGSNTGANTFAMGIGDAVGTTSFVKSGAGTWVLTGANTYTGATSVTAGTLLVNNTTGSGTGTGAVTVAAGTLTGTPVATLGGTGTIGGNVSLTAESALGFNNGGVLAPTAAASGTALDVTGTTTFTTGSIFEWNMSATTPGTDPGVVSNSGSYGQLAGTGAITGSNAVFSIALGAGNAFTDAFWNSDKSWTDVFTGAGATNTLASIFASFGGSGVDSAGLVTGEGFFTSSSTSTLNWTAVPEPTSALAGLLLGAGLLRRRRA